MLGDILMFETEGGVLRPQTYPVAGGSMRGARCEGASMAGSSGRESRSKCSDSK